MGKFAVTRAERAERNALVLKLFLDGANYRQIGEQVRLSTSQVHRVVQRELAAAAKRRDLLTDEALAVCQERIERLFHAHWQKALDGDYRSADLCRKLLGQMARVYGIGADVSPLPAPTPIAEPDPADDDGPQDELSKLRAGRVGGRR